MRLDTHVVVQRSGFRLDLGLVAEPGETVALVGPNGAGKSTYLHAVAGLIALDEGFVRAGARVLADARAGVHVPAEQRRCGLVFQRHLVFPHLTVLDNVAFGPRAAGVPRQEARRRAEEWLERLGVAEIARQVGRTLSGGQGQRVALARALATRPEVLLLDEPFAALDEGAREVVHHLLRTEVAGGSVPVVLVTHDPADAMALADRVVALGPGAPGWCGRLAVGSLPPPDADSLRTWARRPAGTRGVTG